MRTITIGPVGEDKHGDSGTYYFLVPRYSPEDGEDLMSNDDPDDPLEDQPDTDPASPEAFDWIEKTLTADGQGATRCGHEHDCCGCVSHSSPDVIGYDPIRENWVVAQSWNRNV